MGPYANNYVNNYIDINNHYNNNNNKIVILTDFVVHNTPAFKMQHIRCVIKIVS